MVILSRIEGSSGQDDPSIREAEVHSFVDREGTHSALVVLTDRFINTEPNTTFFTNETVGIAMNQNVTFGTIKSVIHNGGTTSSADTGTADTDTLNKLVQAGQNFTSTVAVGMSVHNTTDDTYGNVTAVDSDTALSLDSDLFPDGNEDYVINAVWTGAIVQGAWNFADTGKITLTGGNNNDEASIDADFAAGLDFDNFTAFTGKIDLETYSDLNTNILLSFTKDGVLVGNTVTLDDFIDTGVFTEQSFAIPKASFGVNGSVVNGLTVSIVRLGGAKPTFKLDDLSLEVSGSPLTFAVNVALGDRFHIEELVFAYKDNISSIQTVAGATENVTNQLLDPDTILGLASLPIGFTITRTKAGKALFSATIHNLGEHIAAGAIVTELVTAPDGSSTLAILRAKFEDPLVLTGDSNDTLTIIINDNMSTLERFTCAARGSLET